MVSKALVTIRGKADRERASKWVGLAPFGTRIEFRAPKRSLPQNDRLWACLSDIATQTTWHGVRLSTEDWKLIFMDALNREMRIVPNLEGNGFVNLGRSSSNLSKAEMSDLLELIMAWGAQNAIVFHDSEERAA